MRSVKYMVEYLGTSGAWKASDRCTGLYDTSKLADEAIDRALPFAAKGIKYRVTPVQSLLESLEDQKQWESKQALAVGLHPAQLMAAQASATPPAITKADCLSSGVLDYFRNALAAVGRHSKFGNDKYNPGKPLHWSFNQSTAHADAIASHLAQHGEIDPETGYSHTVALAWRALALLETELLAQGAKKGRAVK